MANRRKQAEGIEGSPVRIEPRGDLARPGEQGKPPVWVAVYTRKSNDENLTGTVTSIDNQKAACRGYIEIQREKGWREFPEAFDDPAESGKSLKRPAVRRLLERIQEGKVQGVIVYKLDRMTRNSRDFHQLLELFEKHNVAFVSATESIDTKSPQGRLMTAIMVQFAQYDRELDQERSKDFHLARARKGLWCAGLAPLGYDLKDKELVVNEQEAELVRRIFDFHLRHDSAIRVAEELNRMGFRRKTYKTQDGRAFGGKPFDLDTVIRILRRKVYIGLITNERTGQEFQGRHQAIVSPETFQRAQRLLDGHNHRGGEIHYARNKHSFLLKGLIRCGECGSAVIGMAKVKKGKIYRYYRCLAQHNGLPTKCAFGSAGADKIEEYIIEKLAAVGWDRPFLERIVKKANALARSTIHPLEKEKREVEDRLSKVRREITGLLGLAKQGTVSREAADEVQKLEGAKRELEASAAALEARAAFRKRVVYDVDAIQGTLQRFARFFRRLPIELQVQMLKLLIERVEVRKNGIELRSHEVLIADLRKALDVKEKVAFGPRHFNPRQGPNTTSNPQGDARTAVVELRENWRGRRALLCNPDLIPPVPPAEKCRYLIPHFSISWPIEMRSITNGERIFTDSAWSPEFSVPGYGIDGERENFEPQGFQTAGLKRKSDDGAAYLGR